jgi:hypothetical protein
VDCEVINVAAHAFYAVLGCSKTRRFGGGVIGHDVDCIEIKKTPE